MVTEEKRQFTLDFLLSSFFRYSLFLCFSSQPFKCLTKNLNIDLILLLDLNNSIDIGQAIFWQTNKPFIFLMFTCLFCLLFHYNQNTSA